MNARKSILVVLVLIAGVVAGGLPGHAQDDPKAKVNKAALSAARSLGKAHHRAVVRLMRTVSEIDDTLGQSFAVAAGNAITEAVREARTRLKRGEDPQQVLKDLQSGPRKYYLVQLLYQEQLGGIQPQMSLGQQACATYANGWYDGCMQSKPSTTSQDYCYYNSQDIYCTCMGAIYDPESDLCF
jgi:hypothetical protein